MPVKLMRLKIKETIFKFLAVDAVGVRGKFENSEKGQGLVETLLAVSVAIIVVTSLISLGVFALRNSRQASYTAQATQIAQRQLEYARAYRDVSTTTWATFDGLRTSCATACYFTGVIAPTAGSDSTSVSPFTYSVKFYCAPSQTCSSTTGVIRADAVVTWTIGGKTQTIYNTTDFTNWRLK